MRGNERESFSTEERGGGYEDTQREKFDGGAPGVAPITHFIYFCLS